MYDIEMQKPSAEFAKCWKSARSHLQKRAGDGSQSWLRANLTPPFLEHLSFRMGNQLFFIRIEAVSEGLEVPGSRDGLLSIAEGCRGHACLMPMKKAFFGDDWAPEAPGWGLLDARTGAPVDPIELVTDELIEMTDWELHDFAVQTVREQLVKEGCSLMSWQGNPGVNPSIWFVDESKGPAWVVVRAARYPETEAQKPHNWEAIAESCAKLSSVGHFASVACALAAAGQDAPAPGDNKLWRGHGIYVRYEGLDAAR
jgi:hypothetical protein